MSTLNAEQKGLKVLSAVYGAASESYRSALGEPKAGMNLTEYAKPILAESPDGYTPEANEFIITLINRIVTTIITDKRYNNKLAMLKKGYLAPLGTDIQHVYTNPVNPRNYDGNNLAGILTKYDNDTKVAYYRRNREEVYPLSVNREQLAGAFVSWEKFNEFVSNLVNAVYSGSEIREQNCFKQAIVNAVADNRILLKSIEYPDDTNSKQIVEEIKNVASGMTFASSQFNKYAEIAKAQTGEDVQPVVTWTEPDRQVLIMRADVLNRLSVEVLASAFNMTEADFRNNLIVVDNFGFDTYDLENGTISGHVDSDIAFLIADISLFQIYDNMIKTVSDFLGYSLTWQFFLHVWQTIGICPFANAVAYSLSSNAKLLGISADKTVVELSADKTEDEININFTPDTWNGELTETLISATKDGEPIDLSTLQTSPFVFHWVQDEKKYTFEMQEGADAGEYEIVFSVHPTENQFPNLIISLGVTIAE